MSQPFNDPAPIGGVRPAIRDLEGRIVIITPTFIATVPNQLSREPGATQERVTADIMVVDGGPLDFGGNPTGAGNKPPTPHTLRVSVPWKATGVYISQTNMVDALRARVGKGVVLGRITRGIASRPGNAPPWNLVKVEMNDPGYALALQVRDAHDSATLVNPEPQPIDGAPPATLAHTHAVTQPHTAQDTAIANGTPLAAAVTAAAAALPPPPPNIPPAVWATMTAEQHAMFAPPAAPAAPAPPAGWTTEFWAQLTDEQRNAISGAQPAGIPNPY